MLIITNNQFAIPLIPECRLSSLQDWANVNNLQIQNNNTNTLDYFVPYRKSYDRIIRGIAADLHEIMFDNGLINFNQLTWQESKDLALEFICDWADTIKQLPIKKHYCHSAHFSAYISPDIIKTAVFFDVNEVDKLPVLLNQKYNLSLSTEIPSLPDEFYNHTVPYWVIDDLYNSNLNLKVVIDEFCKNDDKIIITKLDQ